MKIEMKKKAVNFVQRKSRHRGSNSISPTLNIYFFLQEKK